MIPDGDVQRTHYSLSYNELLERLGLDPNEVHIVRVWTETNVDYLHLMIEPGRVDGGYVHETPRIPEQVGDQ